MVGGPSVSGVSPPLSGASLFEEAAETTEAALVTGALSKISRSDPSDSACRRCDLKGILIWQGSWNF